MRIMITLDGGRGNQDVKHFLKNNKKTASMSDVCIFWSVFAVPKGAHEDFAFVSL